MQTSIYVIAIGSNRRGLHGSPHAEVRAAISMLGATLGSVMAQSRIVASAPVGPSIRLFANAAVLVGSAEEPPMVLMRLKAIERAFGRRRGARWGARVIDLDIVLWSGGAWSSPGLTVPHIAFRTREFVLGPLQDVAPQWRDPLTGLTVLHLLARLRTRRPWVDPPPAQP